MTENEARAKCRAFANQHKVIFDDDGECGFGRSCVGLSSGGNWIDYNPTLQVMPFLPIAELQCAECEPPEGVRAYHKHDCFAVLFDKDEDGAQAEAIKQLAQWIEHMEAQGRVEKVQFETGATGIQAIMSGLLGYCFVVRTNV